MNSEHKSQNLQNIVKKYNIKKYERIDRCRYKIEIFNSVIIKDIYNKYKNQSDMVTDIILNSH